MIVNASHTKARISAIGTYVPQRRLTNADLEALVDTSDEWIVQRTGIKERRIAAEAEFVSHLSVAAVSRMLERYPHADIQDVDMILVATQTGDLSFPSVAAQVQAHFAVRSAGAVDLAATCAGFTYGIMLGDALIRSGARHKVLVIGADTLSKVTDYTDRTTCILFGDGAGAVLLEAADGASAGVIACASGTDGASGGHVYRTGLSGMWRDTPLKPNGKIVQNGREVYKWATQTVPDAALRLLAQAETAPGQVDWFVPHSANLRMIHSICERMAFPVERTLTSLETFGNTSAASIPLAIDLALSGGKVKAGDRMLLYGFGGGLTHCGVLLDWSA